MIVINSENECFRGDYFHFMTLLHFHYASNEYFTKPDKTV